MSDGVAKCSDCGHAKDVAFTSPLLRWSCRGGHSRKGIVYRVPRKERPKDCWVLQAYLSRPRVCPDFDDMDGEE